MRFKKQFSIPGLFNLSIDIGTGESSNHTSGNSETALAPKRELVEISLDNLKRTETGQLFVGEDLIVEEPQVLVNCGYLPPLIVDLHGKNKDYRLFYTSDIDPSFYDVLDPYQELISLFKTLQIKPYDEEDLDPHIKDSKFGLTYLGNKEDADIWPSIVTMNPTLHRAIMLNRAYSVINQIIVKEERSEAKVNLKLHSIKNQITNELYHLNTEVQNEWIRHSVRSISVWDASCIKTSSHGLIFRDKPIVNLECLFATHLSKEWSPSLLKVVCHDKTHLVMTVTEADTKRLFDQLTETGQFKEVITQWTTVYFTVSGWDSQTEAILNLERNLLLHAQPSWSFQKDEEPDLHKLDPWYELIFQTYISKTSATIKQTP